MNDDYEEQEFMLEWDVWKRVGKAQVGNVNLKKGGYTMEEKFKVISSATVNAMNDVKHVLSDDGLNSMFDKLGLIPLLEYKNPSAFVMGYIVYLASNPNTMEINIDVLLDLINVNKQIENQLITKVKNTDIVRYTRLCLINLK